MRKSYRRYKQKLKRKYLVLSKRLLKLFFKRSKPKISHRNKVRLVPSGSEAFNTLLQLIEASEQTIELEYYIIRDDQYGRAVADALIRKASSGVSVKIIYDFIGSLSSRSLFIKLQDVNNIEIYPFNPIKLFSNPLKWEVRDHRKLAIFDGRYAIVSGWNIGDEYFNDSKDYMRDAGVLIEGPAVAILRKIFYDIFEKSARKKADYREIKPEPAGTDDVWIIESGPDKRSLKTVYYAYCLSMMAAKKSIWIENAYFIPPRRIRTILRNAVKRGVDVKVVLPDKIDVRIVKYASYNYFKPLLLSGVKIYERKDLILHSKIGLIDEVWSTIGSTNLHKRGLEKNYELNIVVASEEFGREVKRFMEEDVTNSRLVEYEEWLKRPFINKVKEKLASLISYFL